jgi:hypothetical protein
MSGRAQIIINGRSDREKAHNWIDRAPPGSRIDFKGPRRSVDQNDKLWAMLTDVATQKMHAGRRYTPDQWKCLFLHGCGREIQFLPALDNSTFLPYGQSSSDLSKEEFSELLDFIAAWGAENGVAWSEPKENAA